jgi:hypothetical protein
MTDRGNLRHAADVEQRAKQRMVLAEIADRKFGRRQGLAQLIGPGLPRVLAPEIIGPHEATLEHIGAQRFGFRGVEIRRAHLGHHHHRALKQRFVGQLHDHVIRLLRRGKADGGLGQFRQPNRHVDVGTRIVHAPAAAVAGAVAVERHAAELVEAVKVFGSGRLNPETAAPTAALSFAGCSGGDQDREE